METIEVVEIKVCAKAGSAIYDCKAEATLLALTAKHTVRLIYNNVEYIVDPDKLAHMICDISRE